jgi:dTDP-4-dehydrorhamnose reductase
MEILVIGSDGMLGKDLDRVLSDSKIGFLGVNKARLDITDPNATEREILKHNPSVVILSAAYTKVDACEDHKELANSINGDGAKNVALACRKIDARLIYVSTDYVFNGRKKDGSYTEEDLTDPINAYGQSKLLGEKNVQETLDDFLIIRTSWLFGFGGYNFVEYILSTVKDDEAPTIVNDQVGAPTHTKDLAVAIVKLAKNGTKGVINITNSGECSWYQFASTIYSEVGFGGKVVPISTEEYRRTKKPNMANRPENSRLSSKRFQSVVGYSLPDWKEALKDYLEQIKE